MDSSCSHAKYLRIAVLDERLLASGNRLRITGSLGNQWRPWADHIHSRWRKFVSSAFFARAKQNKSPAHRPFFCSRKFLSLTKVASAKKIALLALTFVLSSCAAVTGPQITSEEERQAQGILKADAAAYQKAQEKKINEIGARLLQASGAGIALKFHYVGRPEQTSGRIAPDAVNAWTDGEGVWITRGMMRFLRDDDERAIVLSHEMAHAYRGHMAYLRVKQALGLALGIPAAIFGGQAAGQLALMLVEAASKKFDRDQEREADIYGLIAVYKAGFDPSVAKDLFRRMAVEMPESAEQGFLSSHPTSVERLLAMERIAETLKNGLDPLKVFAPEEKQRRQ
jgi:predicted Zn-dependent protease